jgi:hypothetical protein
MSRLAVVQLLALFSKSDINRLTASFEATIAHPNNRFGWAICLESKMRQIAPFWYIIGKEKKIMIISCFQRTNR